MNKFMHKGFTLVEMLLVIAIIGILSSMMMVASSESVRTTEANNIVTNLRNFASAAMTFYTDSMDHFTATSNDPADLKTYVVKYMYNGGNSIQNSGDYYVKNNNGKWWVAYKIPDNNDGLKTRLKAKAQSSNLRGSEGIGTFPATDSTSYYNGQQSAVWLRIR